MIFHSTQIPVVDLINAIDQMLIAMNINPILDYKNIQYNLIDEENKPLISIKISREKFEYTWLCDPGKAITYGKLEEKLNQLAVYFIQSDK